MYIIQNYNKITESGRNALDASRYMLTEKTDKPDGILVHSTPLHNIELPDSLKAIVRIGAGTNTIPVDKCTEKGIVVFNTPGGNANAVKELTLAAIIMVLRNVSKADAWVRSLKNGENDPGKAVEAGKEVFRGPELMGKQIGILGLGAIGSRMARACHDLGMRVIGYDPYLSNSQKNELRGYCRITDDLKVLYGTSDIITVHIPLNDGNRGFVDKAAISEMKDGVYLINYARGPILDNDAVCDAIDSGKIKGFATDFPTARQLGYENIVCTPHLGAGTPEAEENCTLMAVHQICDYIENGNITNSVNYPDVAFARTDGARITIMHKNVKGMLGKITEIVSDAELNIENLINKSRGDIAYTVLDFAPDVSLPSEIADKISGIENVIRVRVL